MARRTGRRIRSRGFVFAGLPAVKAQDVESWSLQLAPCWMYDQLVAQLAAQSAFGTRTMVGLDGFPRSPSLAHAIDTLPSAAASLLAFAPPIRATAEGVSPSVCCSRLTKVKSGRLSTNRPLSIEPIPQLGRAAPHHCAVDLKASLIGADCRHPIVAPADALTAQLPPGRQSRQLLRRGHSASSGAGVPGGTGFVCLARRDRMQSDPRAVPTTQRVAIGDRRHVAHEGVSGDGGLLNSCLSRRRLEIGDHCGPPHHNDEGRYEHCRPEPQQPS